MATEYHNRTLDGRRHSWKVERLRSCAEGAVTKLVPLSQITEFDTVYWFDDEFPATCRAVVEHAERIRTADLSDPILLSPDGFVVDGMHRVARAFIDGLSSIKAVQLAEYPEPDLISQSGD